jgi:hypothetical protein
VRVAKWQHFYSIQKLTKENQDVNGGTKKTGLIQLHGTDYRHIGLKSFISFRPPALRRDITTHGRRPVLRTTGRDSFGRSTVLS